jgi:2-phosphosulfolactate phosphatase
MRVHVAFTPAEAERAPVAVVVDVLRATSTIAQALASGYRRVLCCAEIEEARALRAGLEEGVLAGERRAEAIPGFDLGNSPADFVEPRAETLVMTTTNGTRAIVTAAANAEHVFAGSLLNLEGVVAAALAAGGDAEVVCAGVDGRFTIDDAYCAGRIAELLGGERSDAAEAAVRLSRSFGSAEEALRAAENPRQEAILDDIVWCARARRRPEARAHGGAGRRDRRGVGAAQADAAELGSFPARFISAQWAQMKDSPCECSQPCGPSAACRPTSEATAPQGHRYTTVIRV